MGGPPLSDMESEARWQKRRLGDYGSESGSYRMRSNDLSDLQLLVTCHLANGMTFDEIAKTVDRSTANVKKHANAARRKTGARTLPQLVSVVIARDLLVWNGEQQSRIVNTNNKAPSV
jgi:DNA-binding NarL/FixJ family response regulator